MTDIAEELRRDGAAVGEPLSAGKLEALLHHLKQAPCSDNHTFGSGRRRARLDEVWGNPGWPMMGLDRDEVLAAPHYLTWALGSYDIAADYFGEEALLYSISAFVTQPSPHHYRDTHDWHRDRDNPRMLVAFMYGTDVESFDDGAHLYEIGSHRDEDRGENYNGYRPARPTRTVLGPAGTTFFIDPHGCHMAPRPQRRPRLLIWARWCAASCTDGMEGPFSRDLAAQEWPREERLQQALRMIVR
jgi:hypothetical protein